MRGKNLADFNRHVLKVLNVNHFYEVVKSGTGDRKMIKTEAGNDILYT